MISLKGYPKNINQEYLMKVRRIDTFQRKGNTYFVYYLYNFKGYPINKEKVIYLTNYADYSIISQSNKKSIIYFVKNVNQLRIGDIVLINPEGEIVVLYIKNSNDNAIFVTHDCDCNCIMCPQPRDENEKDLHDYNIRMIRLMDKEVKYLALTGGEPTLYLKRIVDILLNCKKYLPRTSLIILTNGGLLSDYDFTKTLVSIKHPDLTFAISLQADVDTIHNSMMGNKIFNKTIEGIYNLARLKQKIEIRIVITKINYQRISDFANFVSYNFPFVYHVAIMGLEPIGEALKNIDTTWIDPYYYQEELIKAIQIFNRMGICVSLYNHQLCILPKSIWKYSEKSISSWKKIYLNICENCNYKNQCGGFFESSVNIHSNFINSIMRGEQTLPLKII